jgi:hypothetical protein
MVHRYSCNIRVLYLAWLRADTLQWNLKWALIETGLTLLWCIALFIRGVWLLRDVSLRKEA